MDAFVHSKYCAFLSYSHKDSEFARWLHRQLESYRVPAALRSERSGAVARSAKLGLVFRDREDFTASHSLSQQMRDALNVSEHLIVLCSPNSVASPNVNEEIRLFKSMKGEDKVLAIILDGEPGDPERECFPKSLRYRLDENGQVGPESVTVIAADARDVGDGRKRAKLKIIAGLLDVPVNAVIRREEAAERARKAFWIGIAAFMTCLAGFAAYEAVDASRSQKIAEQRFDTSIKAATRLISTAAEFRQQFSVSSVVLTQFLVVAKDMIAKLEEQGQTNKELALPRANLLLELADGYRSLNDTQRWKSSARDAHAVLKPAALANQSNQTNQDWQLALSKSYWRQGDIAYAEGDHDTALANYNEMLAISERFVKLPSLSPEQAQQWQQLLFRAQVKIGTVLYDKGKLDDSLAHYALAIKLAKSQLETAPPSAPEHEDWLVFHSEVLEQASLADLKAGNFDTMMRERQLSLDIRKKLADANPGNLGYKWHLARSLKTIGDAYTAQGHIQEGKQHQAASLEVWKDLLRIDPTNNDWKSQFADASDFYGVTNMSNGKYDVALAAFNTALGERSALAAQSPQALNWQEDMSKSYRYLGLVYYRQGNFAAAREVQQKALEIREKLVEADSKSANKNERWERNLAVTQRDLADALIRIGVYAEARDKLIASVTTAKRLNEKSRKQIDWGRDFALGQGFLGEAYLGLGELELARKALKESHDAFFGLANPRTSNLDPQYDLAGSYLRLVRLYAKSGDGAQASAAWRSGNDLLSEIIAKSSEQEDWQILAREFAAAAKTLPIMERGK